MARNLVTIDQVVNDFILGLDGDDYVNNASDTIVRNYALRAVRDLGFDTMLKVKSVKLSSNANQSVDLPDDFVDLIKIGIVGADGLVHVFGQNQNINMSQAYVLDGNNNPIDSDGDGVYDRVDSKGGAIITGVFGNDDSIVFSNYIYQGNIGQIYGLGGGFYEGEYRVNYDQNRIELSSGHSEIVIEYIADEARSSNPTVHVYAEEAVRNYIYWQLVQKKSNVPSYEKERARHEWFESKRIAKSRIMSFSKEDALRTIRRNFKQAPKY